jgi:hypothetical protein
MKDKLIIFFKKYPLFLYLLPVFFVLHGFTENYDFVPPKDALVLVIVYMGFALVFLLLSWLFYKNWLKAAIIATFIMAFHFFFGSVQDMLRRLSPASFLSRYVFLIPLFLCMLLVLVIGLKKRKGNIVRLAFYLNILLTLFIVIDIVWLASKTIHKKASGLSKEFVSCENCPRPDVYLVIADEYVGNSELKEVFHFDDSAFLNQLKKRGFYTIPNSSSNYNFTPYSVASTLNMDYLDMSARQPLLGHTYETIRDNRFLSFLQYHNYRFYNYSYFDFKGQPSYTRETFLPNKTRLITGQTFLSRVRKELRFLLVTKFKSKTEIRKDAYFSRDNNEKLYGLTLAAIEQRTDQPKFVLAHLMMPHYPYYYDRNGKEFPFESLTEGNQTNREHYTEYLQYANGRLLALIDHMLASSPHPPLIILMGDHGFRHFNEKVDPKYYFCNLVSVHLPGNDYTAFTDSLTNVNLLRTVLNTSFGQRLPYLKDTTIIMDNP